MQIIPTRHKPTDTSREFILWHADLTDTRREISTWGANPTKNATITTTNGPGTKLELPTESHSVWWRVFTF